MEGGQKDRKLSYGEDSYELDTNEFGGDCSSLFTKRKIVVG